MTVTPLLDPPHPPDPAGDAADWAASVHRVYHQLSTLESLEPSPTVDALFGRLVGLVVQPPATGAGDLMADPVLQAIRPRLHDLCARGETHLESRWADIIAGSDDPHGALASFPYFDNYRQLTQLEWHAVAGVVDRTPRRVAFLGSGPLPLSSILLARDHGVEVDNIDVDPGALDRSRAVADALGLDGLGFRLADARTCDGLDRYDVVVLAALVGMRPAAKRSVVKHLGRRLAPGALLLARSAHATRSLLYPVLDLTCLAPLDLLTVLHPYHQVINSVVVARRPHVGQG